MSERDVHQVESSIKKTRLTSASSEDYDYDDYDDDVGDIDNDSGDVYVFFKDREEWKDIEPVEQDDGPYSCVKIDYTPKCKFNFNFLKVS